MRRAVLMILCCAAIAASACESRRASGGAPRATPVNTSLAASTARTIPSSTATAVAAPPPAPSSPTTLTTTTPLPATTIPATTLPATTIASTDAATLPPTAPPTAESETTTPAPPADVPVEPPAQAPRAGPPHVLIAGDSTGAELAVAMAEYEAAHPEEVRVSHSAFSGCGLTAGNDGRLHAWNVGAEWIDLSGCRNQWDSVPPRVIDEAIDVVVICIGPWDAGLISFPDGTTVSVLDAQGRQLVTDAYAAFVAAVRGAGAVPVFVRPATIDVEWEGRDDPLDDPLRWDEMRAIVDSLGVDQIDLPGYLAAYGDDGPAGRPDGVHLRPEVLARFVAEEVVPQVILLASG